MSAAATWGASRLCCRSDGAASPGGPLSVPVSRSRQRQLTRASDRGIQHVAVRTLRTVMMPKKKVVGWEVLCSRRSVSAAGNGKVAQPPTVGGGGIKRDAADRGPRGDAGQAGRWY
jgi:hypothetical protein